jgi:hypothetical protein
MTHDELLNEINNVEHPWWMQDALRAVVEWHKPSPIPDWVPTEDKLMCWCAHVYPCPTVKAIEKELE